MRSKNNIKTRSFCYKSFVFLVILLLASSCVPQTTAENQMTEAEFQQAPYLEVTPALTVEPTRPVYDPGELVEYTVQSGDTLPVLAVRFNTTQEEIRAANAILPDDLTTLPPGLPPADTHLLSAALGQFLSDPSGQSFCERPSPDWL